MAIEPSAALAEPCLCSSYLHLLDTLLHPSDWHLFFAPQIANGGYFLCFCPPATTWLKVKMWRKTIFLQRVIERLLQALATPSGSPVPPQFQPIWHMAAARERLNWRGKIHRHKQKYRYKYKHNLKYKYRLQLLERDWLCWGGKSSIFETWIYILHLCWLLRSDACPKLRQL